MTRIQILERPCCGPGQGHKLAEFLREHACCGDTIEYINLEEDGAPTTALSGKVMSHILDGAALPLLVRDGVVVSTGSLPNLLDAVDLLDPTWSAAPRTSLPLHQTTSSGSGCC